MNWLLQWLNNIGITDVHNLAQYLEDEYSFDTFMRDTDVYRILKDAGSEFVHTGFDTGVTNVMFKLPERE